jgi:phenylalanyl-tRNA synthetase beta chain
MRVPFEWLKEIIELRESPEEVAHRLTMTGLEVETLDRVDGDVVFEVNVTPNRPDCLSVIGIARELSAIYNTTLIFPEHDVLADPGELDFNVDILDIELCNRYAGRIVRGLVVGPSPNWIKQRLEKCGIRSINNVVDITNYVLLEFGHPLHAFDLAEIRGNRLRIGVPGSVARNGMKAGLKIKTLDGEEREASPDMLLIWDAERPVAFAGIMGGSESEVKDSTTDIFIESAYFDPASVRKTSRVLGLKTEASYRFERGTDIKILKKALDRAAYLMKEVAGGTVYGKIDIYPKCFVPTEIKVRYERVNKVLGISLSKERILACLEALELDTTDFGEGVLVRSPAYRRDLLMEYDIIEEIARIFGYDNIPARLPEATVGINVHESGSRDLKLYVRRFVKESLMKSGYSEVVNYSFMGDHELDMLGITEDDDRRHVTRIMNPLRPEDANMRTTLIPSLLRNIKHNVSRGNRELRLFETGRIYIGRKTGREAGLPVEKECLAFLSYREKTKSLYKDDTHDFYLIKGILEAMLQGLKINRYSFSLSSEPFLHPGQSADIFFNGDRAGCIGKLFPTIIDALDIKANNPSIVLVELDMDALLPYITLDMKYRPLPKYPAIERDTALVIDRNMESSALLDLVVNYRSDLIEDAYIFDVYQGANIPEDKKSIAFNIRYRAADRTLKDEEIDTLHEALVNYLATETGGQLRR